MAVIDRDALAKDNLPLVAKTVYRMISHWQGHQYEDVYQAAFDGFADAVCRYDPDRNVKFRTYALYWIRGAIIDYIRKECRNQRNKLEGREWIAFQKRKVKKRRVIERLDVAAFRRGILAESGIIFA